MVSRILLLISMISMVFVGTNAECNGCGTRYECNSEGKYLYTYTRDQGTTHSGVSDTWPSAGTLGDHAVYTKAATPCFRGNSEWPLVKTPAMETYENSQMAFESLEEKIDDLKCMTQTTKWSCKKVGCMWKQRKCHAGPQLTPAI